MSRPSLFTASVCLILLMGTGGFDALAWAGDDNRKLDLNPSAADHAIVESLMRLPVAQMEDYPELRPAVLSHLAQIRDESPRKYLQIVSQLKVRAVADQLAQFVTRMPSDQVAIDAASLLFQFKLDETLRSALNHPQDEKAAAAAIAIGWVGTAEAAALLAEVVQDPSRRFSVRNAAAVGLGHSSLGQRTLLKMAEGGEIASDLQFAVSEALLGSVDEQIRDAAAKIDSLRPVAAAESELIPPLKELARMRGSAQHGQKIFEGVGTCAKCHQVRGKGVEVGPDLSEIGGKLSREAMFVSILNPSAAISHNFETYSLLTVDGVIITGLLVNQTDETVTLKTAEGVLKSFKAEDVQELQKQSVSLMPADLQKTMSVKDLVALVDYMMLLKKDQSADAVAQEKPDHAEQPPAQSREVTDAVAGIDVPKDLRIELFAAEPMIRNPTNIDVDHLGRVWVCEAVNYRHFRNTDSEPRKEGDRILVVEDTNQDGVADQETVFYQGTDVDSPHGICVLGNRVIVSAGEHVFSFLDKDGDLNADEKTVLFSGISGVQHDHGIHSFLPGPDGKLYFNFGNEGKQLKAADGSPIVDLAGNVINDSRNPYQQGMVFRCNPDGTEVETLAWNFRNNWELCVDSFGTIWQSDNDDDGNRGVRINYVMQHGNYGYRDELTGDSWQTPRIGMRDDIGQRHWHLNDPGVVPNLLQTGAGSPTGITIYEGNLLPKRFRGEIIHCDPGPNVVRSYPVTDHGAGYKATIANIAKGRRDQWFRPVDVCAAPDGSLIVADWYDPGVGGHHMGDSARGRLFRITPPGHQGYRFAESDLSTVPGAVAALKSPNVSTRYLAGQALEQWSKEKDSNQQKQVVAALQDLFHSESLPEIRARALWLLVRCTSEANQAKIVDIALGDANPDIQITAIRAANQAGHDMVAIGEKMSDSPSPQVRREIALSLRGSESADAAEVWTKLALQHDGQDRWYLEALGIGADGQWDSFFSKWLARVGNDWNTPAGRDIIWRARTPEACEYLVRIIAQAETPEEQERYFRALDFHEQHARVAALRSILIAGGANEVSLLGR